MSIAGEFASMFLELSSALGDEGPFFDAVVRSGGEPELDDGGSIAAAGDVVTRPCSVQFDAVTEAMRQAEGFTDRDMRLLVIGLDGALDTTHTVEVLAGPNAGIWTLQSAVTDPLSIGWECRGRIEAIESDG